MSITDAPTRSVRRIGSFVSTTLTAGPVIQLEPRRQLTNAEIVRAIGPDWNRVWSLAEPEESATSEYEAAAWYAAVLDAPAPTTEMTWAVELGCWRGRTAVVLGHATRVRSDLAAATVDPLARYTEPDLGWSANPPPPEWVRWRLARDGAGHVELVHKPSITAGNEWANGPVSALFIDGLHTDAAVRGDWAAWLPRLTPDAVVVFHDTAIPWIGTFVDELVTAGQLHRPRDAGIGTVLLRDPRHPTPTLDRLIGP